MFYVRTLALLAAAATVVYGQEISSLEPCAQACYDQATGQFGTFGCQSATDVSCMCGKENFKFSIRDCARGSCSTPEYADTVLGAVNALCATAVPAAPTPTTTSAPPPPSTTAPPSTTTPPPTSTSSSSSSSSVTESAAKLTTSSTSTSSASSTSSTSSASSTTSASRTTGAAPAATTSSEPAAGAAGEGLSTATKIGIAVGVIAVAAALIGLIVCVFWRRRQNKRDIGNAAHWKISEPMPVTGRAYGHDYSNSYETGLSELEMKSRRYEDMLPRQVPRQMV